METTLLHRYRPAGLLLAFVMIWGTARAGEPYDLVIRGGKIVDGTGAPWFYGDIAVADGKIVRIGRVGDGAATRTLNATGKYVAPGFIDMMGQTATPCLDNAEAAKNLLTQGITTINAGEGVSAAPLEGEAARSEGWSGFAEYFQMLELGGLPLNVAQTIGHTQVRRLVMGDVDRKPDAAELERMKAYVRTAMEDGAIGVSTALIYPPAVYADTDEISALAAVAGESGGRYFTHMRNEGDRLLEAIDEALEIGRKAKTPVHIFHLKAAGRQNWGRMNDAVAKIRAARAAGEQVAADLYPYINNGLGIEALIHPRHFAGGEQAFRATIDQPDVRATIRQEMESDEGGWENWYKHTGRDWSRLVVGRVFSPRWQMHSGKSLAQIATDLKADPWDVFFDLVKAGAFVLPETMSEENKIRLIREDFISFCTDVGPSAGSGIASHPRAWGSFPRLLGKYVRDGGAVTLERFVAQASAAAANEIMAHDRGRIAEGQAADLIVFDFATVKDHADFTHPDAVSEGIQHVIVNGQLVLEDGELTRARPGRVLRGPGWKPETAPAVVATGQDVPELAEVDALMHRFLARYHIPGASVAVTDHGRLVYARGFGYGDLTTREQATPESLFRIASISKPITATAIMRLVEDGELGLDDHVADVLPGYAPPKPDAEIDERLGEITIRQLLQHSGGWDRDASFDAMFRPVDFAKSLGLPPPADQDAIIRNMIAQPLDFDPGTRQAYSNFGYCLLGRVIEKVSGMPYPEFVRQAVLEPCGALTMVQGRSLPENRQAGEVHYYSPDRGPSVFAANLEQQVPYPYGGWNLEAMDSHGAWLASAVDLARFASAFDDPEHSPLLQAVTLTAMHERPAAPAAADKAGKPLPRCYVSGFARQETPDGPVYSHSGSLTGTATLLVRRPDGRDWVVLLNARSGPESSFFPNTLRPDMDRVLAAVRDWPEHDLFTAFPRHTRKPATPR